MAMKLPPSAPPLLLLALLFLSGATTAPSTTRAPLSAEEKYPSGQLKSRYALAPDGARHGPYALFYPDGKTQETGEYRKGQLEGPVYAFHPNGKPKLRAAYRAGKLDGPWASFDEDGRPLARIEYAAGKRNGLSQEFQAKTGLALSEQFYIDNAVIYPRSPAIIAAELAKIARTKIETVPAGRSIPPHRGGNDSQPDRENAVRLLMEYRYLCYVPWENLALDEAFNAHNEAAAALLTTLGKLDHTPANPGWPEADYRFAYEGTSHSNLAMGSGCTGSVRMYMFDSDPSNIDRIGHRRWCLNPAMGKTGFAAQGKFSAMWSFDGSRKDRPDFDFVAYPARGLFPNTHFDASAAWHVSLNPAKYRTPDEKKIKVTLKGAAVSRSPATLRTGAELKLGYFHIDTGGFAIPNAIIFRPQKISTQPGSAYLVEITGLEPKGDAPAKLEYLVEFFTPPK